MKRLLTNKNTLLIVICILVIMFWVLIINIDKNRCEKNGGKYIWEFSRGTKCHLKD